MAQFTVTVKAKHPDAKPHTIQVNGGDIQSQEDAEAHVALVHPTLTVIPTEAPQ